MMDNDDCGVTSGTNEWRAKSEYSVKTCHSAALATTDLTGLDTSSNSGLRSKISASNRLSYGKAATHLTCNIKFREDVLLGEAQKGKGGIIINVKVQWRALVNTVNNFRIPQKGRYIDLKGVH
jgi:hypothetical protein